MLRSALLLTAVAACSTSPGLDGGADTVPVADVVADVTAADATDAIADAADAPSIDGTMVVTPTGTIVLPAPCPVHSDCTPNTSGCSANNPPPSPTATASPAQLTLPPGFHIAQYAAGFTGIPRWLALAPNGDVFVSEYSPGNRYHQTAGMPPVVTAPSTGDRIEVLRDTNGDGIAETRLLFDDGATHTDLLQPFGMAFHPSGALYVGCTGAVLRYAYASGQTAASGAPTVVTDLPAGGYNRHWTRNVLLSPDAHTLYVTVGSATDNDLACESMDRADARRAAVTAYDLLLGTHQTFASGLRNPNGLAFYPGTTRVFTVVNERDELGDDLVPDYLTELRSGAFYGWPYWYYGNNLDPRHINDHPTLPTPPVVPDLAIGAHVAALGLVFYTGAMFPHDYSGDAFVSMHGSWNRSARAGYKVARVHFNAGRPTSVVDDFVTGWTSPDGSVRGRPVGLLQLADGSLLIVDDGPPGGVIWRVTYP